MNINVGEERFDPFWPLSFDELHEALGELRDRHPAYRTASDMWVVSRYADVRMIMRSPNLFSSRPNADEGSAFPTDAADNPQQLEQLQAIMAGFPSEVSIEQLTSSRSIIAADPPDHTRMRRIVNRGFTPPRIAELSATIDAIVNDCLSSVSTADRFEVVEQLAVPLPVRMIADLLGIDPEHYGNVKRWSDDFASAAVGEVRGTTAGAILAMNMFREFSMYFAPLIEERRRSPKNDIVSAMVRSMDEDALNTVETIMMAITVMVAGNETSTNLIGNTLVELLAHPDQLALLLADGRLLAGAVDEANRLTAPVQFNFREALEDVDIGGTIIPKGATVVLHIAAANRDSRQFDRPNDFDITRPAGQHLSFGHGIHFCLGAHLANEEVRSAIGGLIPHLQRFELDLQSLEATPGMLLNGWRRIELVAR